MRSHGRRDEAADGEEVGDVVDVLAGVEVGEGRADFLADGAGAFAGCGEAAGDGFAGRDIAAFAAAVTAASFPLPGESRVTSKVQHPLIEPSV